MQSTDETPDHISKLVWETGFEPKIALCRSRRIPQVLQNCLTLVPGLCVGVQWILRMFGDDKLPRICIKNDRIDVLDDELWPPTLFDPRRNLQIVQM